MSRAERNEYTVSRLNYIREAVRYFIVEEPVDILRVYSDDYCCKHQCITLSRTASVIFSASAVLGILASGTLLPSLKIIVTSLSSLFMPIDVSDTSFIIIASVFFVLCFDSALASTFSVYASNKTIYISSIFYSSIIKIYFVFVLFISVSFLYSF